MKDKTIERLVNSSIGNLYIDKGFEEFAKTLASHKGRLTLQEQREVAFRTYLDIYTKEFPDTPKGEAEKIVERVLCNIEKNLAQSSEVPTKKLKRVDGFWRQFLGKIDKYPLVKQLEESKDYLIAGLKPNYYEEEDARDNEIVVGFPDLPVEITQNIELRRDIKVIKGKEKDEWGYYPLITYKPSSEIHKNTFREYLRTIVRHKGYKNYSHSFSHATVDDFVIGHIRKKIIKTEKEILG